MPLNAPVVDAGEPTPPPMNSGGCKCPKCGADLQISLAPTVPQTNGPDELSMPKPGTDTIGAMAGKY